MEDTKDSIADQWNEYRQIVAYLIDDKSRTNESGKRFARGCLKQLDMLGYLSEKQQMTLKLIYSNSVSSL